MRRSKTVTDEAAQVEFLPGDATEPLDLRQLFHTVAPLELDLGCGDGSFLAALAANHPERNFLGIERLVGRVRTACRKIAAQRLTNARIIRVDIAHAVACLIPAASVEVCHVMFPDPYKAAPSRSADGYRRFSARDQPDTRSRRLAAPND